MSRELGALLAAAALLGCDEDRPVCDDALEKLCACPSRPCEQSPALPIIERLRKCEDVVEEDIGLNVHICIADGEGGNYCPLVDALVANDETLCSVSCADECRTGLGTPCTSYQYERCDLP